MIVGLVLAYAGQLIAVIGWPVRFPLAYHMLGDLSVRGCDVLIHDFTSRFLCSPLNVWYTMGLIGGGVCAILAGALLGRQWMSLILFGGSLILWAFFPLDTAPGSHRWIGIFAFLLFWASVFLARPRFPVTWVWCAISGIGVALALRHFYADPPGTPGIYQRVAIDALSLGLLMHASWLISRARQATPKKRAARQRRREEAAHKDAALRAATQAMEQPND